MRIRLLSPALLLLALAATAVSGCGWRGIQPTVESPPQALSVPEPDSAIPGPAPAPPPPPKTPAAPSPALPPPPVTAADKAYANGMAARQEGEHERALELFVTALKEKPGHTEASKGFDEALVAIKKHGDAAYAQGKAEEAGKYWMGTLRYMGNPAAKGKTYPFTRAEVQGLVARLTASQMQKGLLSYRKGEIPAAIAAWKTILSYDPDNEEAARSIKTASTQLENLKKIPPAQ